MMKRRITLIFFGAAVLVAAYLCVRIAAAKRDPYYRLPQSARQEVTELALKNVVDVIAQQNIPYLVYIVLDDNVDSQRAIASLPKARRIEYRRGDPNMKLPRDDEQLRAKGNIARALSVRILTEGPGKAVVSTAWISASELGIGSSILTIERKWWRWKVTKTQVTTAI